MLLAEGAIDIAGEFDLKPWDIAALAPVVREAGGQLTTIDGDESIWTPSVLATNRILHEQTLATIRSVQ
jgi:histidinol-phosphatase